MGRRGPPRCWTDDLILAKITTEAERLGRTPKSREWEGPPSGSLVRKRMGGWSAAMRAAGLEPNHKGRDPTVECPRGHPYETTIGGYDVCHICKRERERAERRNNPERVRERRRRAGRKPEAQEASRKRNRERNDRRRQSASMDCPRCGRNVAVRQDGRLTRHRDLHGVRCRIDPR